MNGDTCRAGEEEVLEVLKFDYSTATVVLVGNISFICCSFDPPTALFFYRNSLSAQWNCDVNDNEIDKSRNHKFLLQASTLIQSLSVCMWESMLCMHVSF